MIVYDISGTSEAVDLHMVANFLPGGTKQVHAEQFWISNFLPGGTKDVHTEEFGLVAFDFDADFPITSDHGSYPDVIHAILRSFLSDDVLPEVHDAVSCAEMRDSEEQDEFGEWVSKDARVWQNVFSKDDLTNYYVQGLNTAVREIFNREVRRIENVDRRIFSTVRK